MRTRKQLILLAIPSKGLTAGNGVGVVSGPREPRILELPIALRVSTALPIGLDSSIPVEKLVWSSTLPVAGGPKTLQTVVLPN